jgi:hypothetical protein
MHDLSITPSIEVTIGREMRLYHAYVTTAPVGLDAPATMTLYAATLADVAGFAADPITHDVLRADEDARLVLVDAADYEWQRSRYLGERHLFVHADPVLVGLKTLQHWLWQRLRAPLDAEANA